ncbi:MAG: hypothetical protein IIA05_01560 [Proteobacteria bacterium]|nr:hypothetical protein [Pseudomonadota bacterium]
MRKDELVRRRLRQLIRKELERTDLQALVQEALEGMDLRALVQETLHEQPNMSATGPVQQPRVLH